MIAKSTINKTIPILPMLFSRMFSIPSPCTPPHLIKLSGYSLFMKAAEIEPNIMARAVKIKDLDREPFHTFIHLRPISITNTGIRIENMPNPLFIIFCAIKATPVLVQLATEIYLSFTSSKKDLLVT